MKDSMFCPRGRKCRDDLKYITQPHYNDLADINVISFFIENEYHYIEIYVNFLIVGIQLLLY